MSYPNHTVARVPSLKAVYQYLVHILLQLTDNCSSSISRRVGMAVEMFSNQTFKLQTSCVAVHASLCLNQQESQKTFFLTT